MQKPFRTVHYLGSKLRMLDFIKKIADEVDPNRGAVCDLFSGSGSVSQKLSGTRRVISVDIQKYSHILCSALLKPYTDKQIYSHIDNCKNSPIKNKLEEALEPIIHYENFVINEDNKNNLEPLCDFLENASLYVAMNDPSDKCSQKLRKVITKTLENISELKDVQLLATTYFGGIYFSYKQAMYIDIVLHEINQTQGQLKNTLMAALLSTASDLVNTVGKQFAQPIRPRDKNGNPKKTLIPQLQKDRELNVISYFEKWLHKYTNRDSNIKEHKVLCMDFNDALNLLPEDVSIVYADPPYTRDHYSRFYHGLETLCLNDFPEISKTKIGGRLKISRGLYRLDRHQSPFNIKSQAPKAFDSLFKKVSEKGKILMLSYSPYDETKKSHPRVMKMSDLLSIANKYFSSVKSYNPGIFLHNKLNHLEKHLEASDNGELIIVCKN